MPRVRDGGDAHDAGGRVAELWIMPRDVRVPGYEVRDVLRRGSSL
jgi:hypothetical protein